MADGPVGSVHDTKSTRADQDKRAWRKDNTATVSGIPDELRAATHQTAVLAGDGRRDGPIDGPGDGPRGGLKD